MTESSPGGFHHWRWPFVVVVLGGLCIVSFFYGPLIYGWVAAQQAQQAATAFAGITDKLTQSYTNVTDQWEFKTLATNRMHVLKHTRSAKHEHRKEFAGGYLANLIVEVEVQATFDYYVSMDRSQWKIEARKAKQGNLQLRVTAPPLQCGPGDVHIRYTRSREKNGSWVFSTTNAIDELMKELSEEVYPRQARMLGYDPTIRESARRQVRQFILDWVIGVSNDPALRELEARDIDVVFPDETNGETDDDAEASS